MPLGTVKWFSNEKGYGFLVVDGSREDVFIHHTAIDMTGFKRLDRGQRVEFELYYGPKGMTASYLRPLSIELRGKKRGGTVCTVLPRECENATSSR